MKSFREPLPIPVKPNTDWQDFLDKHGAEYYSRPFDIDMTEEEFAKAHAGLDIPDMTKKDFEYSQKLIDYSINNQFTLGAYLNTFTSVTDQADKFAWWLFDKGITPTEISNNTDIPVSAISDILRGKGAPSLGTATTVFKYVGMSPNRYFMLHKKGDDIDLSDLF